MANKLQLKHNKNEDFNIENYTNVILAKSEPLYDTVHKKLYICDGKTVLSNLTAINVMSDLDAETIINLIANEAGLENIHPHKFRRSCATAMAKRGIGVQDISVILGHEKISTTQEYLVTNNNEVKRNYERMFA